MKKDDQDTAGDGNDLNEDQDAGSKNSGTDPEDKTNKQGQQSDDDKTGKSKKVDPKDTSDPDGNDDADDVDDDDDDDGQKLEGDEKLVKISQAKLDAIVQKAKDKQKRSDEKKHSSELKKLNNKVERAEAEIESYRKIVATQVQAEVDALPEEVKKMSPATTETASGLKKVQDWLPDAKALAAKLGTSVKNSGNKPNPPASLAGGTKTEEEVLAESRNHPIYRSF